MYSTSRLSQSMYESGFKHRSNRIILPAPSPENLMNSESSFSSLGIIVPAYRHFMSTVSVLRTTFLKKTQRVRSVNRLPVMFVHNMSVCITLQKISHLLKPIS